MFHTLLKGPVLLRTMFRSHDLCRFQCHIRDLLESIREDLLGDIFL